jgi:ABC-2 type transport system ATP-binding protein
MLADVASVDLSTAPNGYGTLMAYPRKGTLIIEDISQLAAAEKWDVKQLNAEAGRLDDVFRALTTHDTDRARAGRKGGAA